MKRQTVAPKRHGDERERSESEDSLLSRILRRKPSLPSVDVIKPLKPEAKAIASEAKHDLEIALGQIFGIELKPGKEHNLSQKADEYAAKHEKPEKPQVTQEFFEYSQTIVKAESRADSENTMVIKQQVEQILVELRNLKDSSDELETVFKDVVIDDVPEKPGIYHLTFFEGFLKLVIKMKDKVEDGVIFAKLFKSRKRERSYSAMAKKGGTSYTLHHDRTPATQTG